MTMAMTMAATVSATVTGDHLRTKVKLMSLYHLNYCVTIMFNCVLREYRVTVFTYDMNINDKLKNDKMYIYVLLLKCLTPFQ